MKIKRRNFKVISLVLLLVAQYSNAQLSPNIDGDNWELVTAKSDEFNTLDLTKWHVMTLGAGQGPNDFNYGGNSSFRTANTSVANGKLIFKADGPNPGATPPYNYMECCYTGGVISQLENYQYGYLEMYAQLPGAYCNGVPNGLKFYPTFWTFHVENKGLPSYVHDEIDILEPNGQQYEHADVNFVGWHDEDGIGGAYKVGEGFVTSPTPLFSGFHKYAVEWNTDRIIFYFDDVPFYSMFNNPKLVMKPQYVVMYLSMWNQIYDFDPLMTFPQYMTVDYFRYYQLKKDCGTNAVINNNTELTSFSYGVKNSITIGNTTSTIGLTSGQSKTFRAVDETIIQGDFTAPIGCELNVIPTPCN